ncbi:hypothetical protein HDU93_000064 [Gonapodya sp. JEL0774]|nr:hypothetical protein HDU93_000064 [Gonapodya sp. JEL0774]
MATRTSTTENDNGITTLLDDMKGLHLELRNLREYHDVPDIVQLRELAQGVWRVNELYQTRLEQLTRERNALNHEMTHIWNLFDSALLEPIWNVADPLLPTYQRLSQVLHNLEDLRHRGGYSTAQVADLQRELNTIENECTDECDTTALPVSRPNAGSESIFGGQAVLRSMLEKCYRMVRLLLAESTPVSRTLVPIRNRLLALNLTLKGLKEGLKESKLQGLSTTVSAEEVELVQNRLREIESLTHDGKFVDEKGNIPEGI